MWIIGMIAMFAVIGALLQGLTSMMEALNRRAASRETKRAERAAKRGTQEALRQKAPPVSRHAVLNPAELKARR